MHSVPISVVSAMNTPMHTPMTAIFTTCSKSEAEDVTTTLRFDMNQPFKQAESAMKGILSASIRRQEETLISPRKREAMISAQKNITAAEAAEMPSAK